MSTRLPNSGETGSPKPLSKNTKPPLYSVILQAKANEIIKSQGSAGNMSEDKSFGSSDRGGNRAPSKTTNKKNKRGGHRRHRSDEDDYE